MARPRAGPRQAPFWVPPGCPVAPLWPHRSFGNADFLYIFLGFCQHTKISINLHTIKSYSQLCYKQRQSELVSFNSCKNEVNTIEKVFGKVDTFETYHPSVQLGCSSSKFPLHEDCKVYRIQEDSKRYK